MQGLDADNPCGHQVQSAKQAVRCSTLFCVQASYPGVHCRLPAPLTGRPSKVRDALRKRTVWQYGDASHAAVPYTAVHCRPPTPPTGRPWALRWGTTASSATRARGRARRGSRGLVEVAARRARRAWCGLRGPTGVKVVWLAVYV